MKNTVLSVKQKLEASISQLSEVSWMFSKKPGVYFTRDRKLPFPKVISCLVAMEGGTLTSELLKYFGCSANIASSSAFVQQRSKISKEAFPMLFNLFVRKTDSAKLYKGLRLIAADGSDIQIPTNPNHPDSYFPGTNGQASYNMLHLDVMYDLLRHFNAADSLSQCLCISILEDCFCALTVLQIVAQILAALHFCNGANRHPLMVMQQRTQNKYLKLRTTAIFFFRHYIQPPIFPSLREGLLVTMDYCAMQLAQKKNNGRIHCCQSEAFGLTLLLPQDPWVFYHLSSVTLWVRLNSAALLRQPGQFQALSCGL